MVNCAYIHIPFCEKKCNYCAFCSYSLLKYKNDYIEALIKEINFLYKNKQTPLKTIYFGGGTPSLLEVSDVEKILKCFNFDSNTEITLELNPNSLSKEKLKGYKFLGVNRLSIGVQSFDDKTLNILGRGHNSKDALNAIFIAKDEGFKNISIDLIYGFNNQNWAHTLKIAKSLDVEHISLYGLKIEDKTNFKLHPPKNLATSDKQADMYEEAVKSLEEKFERYEFSNFACSKEFYSKHNISYWKRREYYGFGLSASGFINNKRYTNTFNFKEYLNNPLKKDYYPLSTQENIEEEIFLGLRLKEGIDFCHINKKYNIDIYKKYKNLFDKYIENNFMEKTKNGVALTLKGVLVSNEILCNFIELS